MGSKPLERLALPAEPLGWTEVGVGATLGRTSSRPRLGWDAKPPLDPGFHRLDKQGTEPKMLWTILVILVIVAVALFIFRRVRSR